MKQAILGIYFHALPNSSGAWLNYWVDVWKLMRRSEYMFGHLYLYMYRRWNNSLQVPYVIHAICPHICFALFSFVLPWLHYQWLTRRGWDKMAAIFQTTFSNGFSWMKMYRFRLRFHWSLFPRLQLTIFQIDSDKALALARWRAIIWTNDG